MRFFRLLRRYNQVALALLFTWALVATAIVSVSAWRTAQELDRYGDWRTVMKEPSVSAEEIETAEGIITA